MQTATSVSVADGNKLLIFTMPIKILSKYKFVSKKKLTSLDIDTLTDTVDEWYAEKRKPHTPLTDEQNRLVRDTYATLEDWGKAQLGYSFQKRFPSLESVVFSDEAESLGECKHGTLYVRNDSCQEKVVTTVMHETIHAVSCNMLYLEEHGASHGYADAYTEYFQGVDEAVTEMMTLETLPSCYLLGANVAYFPYVLLLDMLISKAAKPREIYPDLYRGYFLGEKKQLSYFEQFGKEVFSFLTVLHKCSSDLVVYHAMKKYGLSGIADEFKEKALAYTNGEEIMLLDNVRVVRVAKVKR